MGAKQVAPSAVMHVDDLLRSRRSVRAFEPAPVPARVIRQILEVAGNAPSNSNTQPWRVRVLAGETKANLTKVISTTFLGGRLPAYTHFPDPLPEEFSVHQADFATRFYSSLGIERNDQAGRAEQSFKNFSFFNAPVGLIITIDSRLYPHSWMDLGIFVQSVMLAAKARGLDTCPQVSFARCHSVISQHLSMHANELTVCGMSVGFADQQAAVNNFQMPRKPVEEFADFLGFPEIDG